MIPDLPIDKILQAAMRSGADYAEVFFERTRQTTVVCDNHRLENAATSAETGIGIRVLKDGRTASGATNDLTRKSLLCLSRSVGRAVGAKRTRIGPVVLVERKAPSITTARQHPSGTELAEKCGIVLRADEIAWKTDRAIQQVRILYRDAVRCIWVASSEGTVAEDEQVETTLTAHVIAGDGRCLQTGFEPAGGAIGFELFEESPPEVVAELAAARAVRLLTAHPALAGTMPVILSAEAGGTMIHEAVGHGLEGDFAGQGMSVYSGKVGEMVASERVSVVDDATLSAQRGSFTFDDEGTPAARTVLIEGGVLKAYLSNQATCRKYGYPLTGNGRRHSYGQVPLVRMTNTFILPGKDDPEKILRDTPAGLFVRRMGGGQVNTINGDFVFEVQEGYLIENGRRGPLVRGALLIGNGPKVLSAIDRVGTDLHFSIGTCGKEGQDIPVSCGQPTIRIPELVVGGRA